MGCCEETGDGDDGTDAPSDLLTVAVADWRLGAKMPEHRRSILNL